MPMHPGGRHQGGDSVDQFQRVERQLGGAVGLWLGQMIAEMLVIDGLKVLESKGRASTVTELPFQTGTIPAGNSNRI